MGIVIRNMFETDWVFVEEIYVQGLKTGMATFETESPGWQKWDNSHMSTNRYVAEENGQILGWVALSPVSDRCVYGGVAEVSVYMDLNQTGRGVGGTLLAKVIQSSEEENIWTLQSSIFVENEGSIALHKKYGFREIGIREKIGKLNGIWRDTLMMERRSKVIL